MKRDRELLGLPPKNKYKIPKVLKILGGALLVIVLSSLAGKLIGKQSGYEKQLQVSKDFLEVINSTDTEIVLPLLKSMRLRAATGNSDEKILFSVACSYASNIMPRRRAWLEEGLFQIDTAIKQRSSDSVFTPEVIMHRAGLLFELGREKEALTELLKLNGKLSTAELLGTDPKAVEGGINFYNLYAYILASASDESVKNGELALKLIKRVIIQPEGVQSMYLDTLAEAYHSVGKTGLAINAQRFALARSSYTELWLLTEHYQNYETK